MSKSILDEKAMEFDATHSWNGYSYQGKIALIVVLDLIINLTKQQELFEPYKLEFELLEDFSILKDDQHIQIHQVKSYGIESLTKYKDAVWILLGKSVSKEHPLINNAYLHTAESITSKKGEIDSKDKLLEVLETYSEPSDSSSQQIASPLDYYQYVDESGLKEAAFNKFEIYMYSDGKKYCNLGVVNEKVKEKILEYYTIINKKDDLVKKGILERQIEYSYNFLLGLIDDHINQRHINRQTKLGLYAKEIQFVEFIDILDTKYERLPKSYYVYYLKNKLMQIFVDDYSFQKNWVQEQLITSNQEPGLIQYCEGVLRGLEKVKAVLKKVHSDFSDDEFLLFCNRISPHIKIEEDDGFLLVDELINTEFVKSPWINTLISLQNEIDEESLLIKIGKEDYLPSTINHTYNTTSHYDDFQRQRTNALIEATISKIAVNIIENRSIHEELYKIDKIITGNVNAPLKEYIPKVTDYRNLSNDKEGHHIMDIKNVVLIDLKNTLHRREKDE